MEKLSDTPNSKPRPLSSAESEAKEDGAGMRKEEGWEEDSEEDEAETDVDTVETVMEDDPTLGLSRVWTPASTVKAACLGAGGAATGAGGAGAGACTTVRR
jgi:hypothetical protein